MDFNAMLAIIAIIALLALVGFTAFAATRTEPPLSSDDDNEYQDRDDDWPDLQKP